MKQKILSIVLLIAMMLNILPAINLHVLAATSGSDMDPQTALGIDTSVAPDGYDPYSVDNPYGRNTIELSPVYELYTVGLADNISFDATYDTKSTLQNGENSETHISSFSNSLKTKLYGNEKWTSKTIEAIMNGVDVKNASSGTTTSTGNYTLISLGTVPDTSASDIDAKGYLNSAANSYTDFGNGFKYALSSVASGNFDGNKNGLSAQTAMVYTSDYTKNGGLYLRFGNSVSGTYGSNEEELLSTEKNIGNSSLKYNDELVEDFANDPYQLQNYLQVTTGDWNGDGMDEVAVYVPETGNSRILVYALQLTSSDDKSTAYLDASKWSVVWTYYLREGDVVSNMVSLVNGDVNQDGTDDLAATWGYYYGPTQNIGSTAVVLFGAKGTAMLTESQQFNLTYGSSDIVRASFTFGNMAGSDSDVLILCGQSDADLKEGNTNTRYVALYNWNGEVFTSNVYQNFNLFEKIDGEYVWPAMAYHSDKYYSQPLCTANSAVITQGLGQGGDLLYFDSIIIEYTESGLSIKEAWDNTAAMQQNAGTPVEYVEYGAVAGDFTGQNGAAALVTMIQTFSATSPGIASYTVTGSHQEPSFEWKYYYKNWLYKILGIETWYYHFTGFITVADNATVNVNYKQHTIGDVYMVTADPFSSYNNRTKVDFSTAICLANTDNDSSYMNYTGSHYYTYTDPEVLAVLASPPYFSDLLGRDDLSGNYAESTTTYSRTSGSGSGYNVASTITVGAYVSFEQDIKVFGVTVASVEAEAQITAGFTFETEKTSTLEQTVTYSATSGEDMVAFYSIPMEIYKYKSYVADGLGGYTEVMTTVNIPHEASVRLLSKDEYDSIAKDYSVLPSIAENVLTHTIGDPSTYPTDTNGYNVIAKYNGTPSAVGFSSTGGGAGISQEIAMSKETNTSFSASVAVEAKAGAGAGGFKVGFIAGAEVGAGYIMVSTDGSSFSGEMQNMPIEAQPYKYGMNWRIFNYKYSDGSSTFPVVSYIVSDVQSPPPLPSDFEQDISATTSDSLTLKWSYNKLVAGFKLYRYYEFPDGSGSYEIDYIPFTEAVSYDSNTGTYQFSYKDNGLSPYTEYYYQIKSIRATEPSQSIYSEPLECRTKTTVGYPVISISGLNENGKMPIYPDADSTVTINIADSGTYNGLGYQWQKLVDSAWVNLSGRTSNELTISNAGSADNSIYRCRVNAIYYDQNTASNYYISAYSDALTTAYSKRTPTGTLTAEEKLTTLTDGSIVKGITSNIELYSANENHSSAPTGKIMFTLTGTDYKYSETLSLATSSSTKYLGGAERYYSTASLSIASLPDGVYTVSAYYSGSRVFKDMEISKGVIVVVGNGSAYSLTISSSNGDSVTKFNYSDNIFPSLLTISKGENDIVQTTPVTGVTYKLVADGSSTSIDFNAGGPTPDIGSYTIQAIVGGHIVASKAFTIAQKAITIYVEDRNEISSDAVSENPPITASIDLDSSELSALKLSYITINSAGNSITLNNDTNPGKYSVTACTSSETPTLLYNNYNITYVPGTYTIIGATYRLTAVAADYTDQSGTRSVGSVGISNAQQDYADYTAETVVLLYATPQAGYQVDTWTALFENGTSKTQTGGLTYTFTTEAQTATVTVTFKTAEIKLSTITQPAVGGIITCSDEYFTSGAYVSYGAEYTFTATPSAGYHFSKWQVVSGGSTTQLNGSTNPDGSNNIAVIVGKDSMTVYAIFVRDSYILTLNGDIIAYYMYDDDDDFTTPPVKRMITSGNTVPGDTQITVEPKTGYQAAEDAYIHVNSVATTDSIIHTFNITQNTVVSLDTVCNKYAVVVTADNGSVTTALNGLIADNDILTAVDGGSAVTFTAHADRGYVFDHWNLNGTDVENSTQTLTIAEINGNTDVIAVFTANTAYTAVAAVSVPTRGTMNYTLYDIYNNIVGTENTLMPVDGLTVYKGESLVLSVALNSGSMMEQWKVNDINTYTTLKTHVINNIERDINAVAYLKAASSYSVNFLAMGTTGSTLTAQADGSDITTGTLQYGGSELTLSATPASSYMLDYWTITAGDLTAPENSPALDSDGKVIKNPTYTINPLKQNITIRAHFIPLVTNTVTLPNTTVMGVSAITYVTPIIPTDDGIRNLTTEEVCNGGITKLSFTPNSTYSTDTEQLKSVLEVAVNSDAIVAVEENEGVYLATITNLQSQITLNEEQIYYRVYTITVPSGVTASCDTAAQGDTVALTVKPGSGYMLSGLTIDNGTLNETVSSALLIYTFEMPATDVIVSASFSLIPIPVPIPGGDGDEDPGSEPDEITIPASGNGTSMDITVNVNNGIASMNMDSDTLGDLNTFSGTLSFDLSTLENLTGATIPSATFSSISGASGINGLSIALPDAEMTFDPAAMSAIKTAGSGDVTLSAAMVDTDTLSAEQQAKVKDRPVIDLTLKVGSKTVSSFNSGNVQVKVPYSLAPDENPDAVVVWYLNDDGNLEAVTGKYDDTSKCVIFNTNHFSKYIIGVLPFNDVSRDKWYFDNVSYVYANGLFSGTGTDIFNPDLTMTRAMLVTVLWRIENKPVPEGDSRFTDIVKGEWYADAVAWAAENEIVSGYGNGLFGTDDALTREQMAVILMNYAKYKKYDVSASIDLSKFTDSGNVSRWANAAMQWANAEGLINGTGNNCLSPKENAARCQVAAILQRFIDNIVQ